MTIAKDVQSGLPRTTPAPVGRIGRQLGFLARSWVVSGRRAVLLLGDLLVLIGAMLAGRLLSGTVDSESGQLPLWALLLAIIWVAVARALNAYDLALAAQLRRALPRAAIVTGLTMGCYSLIPYWSPPLPSSRWLVVLHGALLLGSLLTWRAAYGLLLRRPPFRIRALVVGRSEATAAVAEMLRARTGHDYELAGLLDCCPTPRDNREFVDYLIELAQSRGIHEVIVDESQHRSPELDSALLELAERRVRVLTTAELYEALTGRALLPLAAPPGLGASTTSGNIYALVRRLADVLVAFAALVTLSPLLLIAALAITLNSPGHPLYWQERVGRYGRRFRVAKLRTMVQHAEAGGRPIWARDRDPRVTRVGAFLRRSRFDEMPQLWNVLRGEMSLIGPRPERPEFVALLTSKIPVYRARHVIRPGITGWAQVQYKYGSSVSDAAEKLQYDLYYIRHRSLFLDALILLKTLFVVLGLKGV